MTAAARTITVYYGPVINPKSLECFQALPRCLLAVCPDGNISWIEEDISSSELEAILHHHGLDDASKYVLTELKPGEFIMPGFIDGHIVCIPFHHRHRLMPRHSMPVNSRT